MFTLHITKLHYATSFSTEEAANECEDSQQYLVKHCMSDFTTEKYTGRDEMNHIQSGP